MDTYTFITKIFVLLFVAGCAAPLENLENKIEKSFWAREYNRTVDGIKGHYFTEEAFSAIKDIPCISGFTVGGSYVSGANFWGTLISVLTGSGLGRKCVINDVALKNYGPEAIIHEYLHHLDDIGRDGGEKFIDVEEFKLAFSLLARDSRWYGLAVYAQKKGDRAITNIFGLGEMSEQIAYVGGRMATQGAGPEYMWNVFRRVFKR